MKLTKNYKTHIISFYLPDQHIVAILIYQLPLLQLYFFLINSSVSSNQKLVGRLVHPKQKMGRPGKNIRNFINWKNIKSNIINDNEKL